jgi:uncharacterized protein (DUF1778 family)
MSKDTRKQINLRIDPELDALIDDMRRQKKPIPTVSQLMRQALVEKAERDLKRGTAR